MARGETGDVSLSDRQMHEAIRNVPGQNMDGSIRCTPYCKPLAEFGHYCTMCHNNCGEIMAYLPNT
ncbi:hypothetical protein KIPB_015449, partial [Kipferlia bialata]|eukprot:g15449.t1